MKHIAILSSLFVLTVGLVRPAQARDIKHVLDLKAALESSEAKGKVDAAIKFYFSRENPPQANEKIRTETARGRAHANRGAVEAMCNEAFLSAMIQLQRSAKQRGANGVINIVSAFQNHPKLSSVSQFECYQGARTISVWLRGDIVKLVDK